MERDDNLTFRDAFRAELLSLGETGSAEVAFSGSTQKQDLAKPVDPGAEPFVLRSPRDLTGIALSGGGIRSATFNLGLLQGLAEYDLLRKFEYLSTVSGGGYIGSFWSAYRRHKPRQPGSNTPVESMPTNEQPATTAPPATGKAAPREAVPFPTDTSGTNEKPEKVDYARAEPEEVRHLREFSRFLAPRWGLFEIETWQFFGGAVSAILPAVLVGLSVLALLIWWMLIASAESVGGSHRAFFWPWLPCFYLSHMQMTLIIAAVSTVVVMWGFERETMRIERQKGEKYYGEIYFVVALIATIVDGLVLWLLDHKIERWRYFELFPGSVSRWNWRPFFSPALAWVAALVFAIVIRVILSHWTRDQHAYWRAPIDRVIGRLLGLAVFWFAMMVFLFVAFAVWNWSARGVGLWTAGVGGSATTVYGWVQRFLARQPNRAKTGSTSKLERYALPLLATIALVASAVGVACLIFTALLHGSWWMFWLPIGALAVAVVFYNPNEIGMHALYRSRLARTYLGASNPKASNAAENRQSTQRPDDDLLLADLSKEAPLHLICCTANDLGGNHLANLSRGARSAVLSPFGITLADRFQPWNEAPVKVTLASAMTASGAAFNSNMGSLSMELGPSATFLMAALNLRLGYWYRFSRSRLQRWFPGLDLLREMFSRTQSGPESPSIHLSDGGHFEDLALYELLRRRCRYVIASDCGADPDVAFDDVGNALRRAREDFGVEVEIDLSVLKPNEKRYSRQHLAVGEIRYPDGDRGVLLLFKPTLVGDEPGDVLQYKARNERFPHESTGDQFYDEKQWESYRRLGLHAARIAFRFLGSEGGMARTPDDIFGGARWEWLPVPETLQGEIVGRTSQLNDLEQQVRNGDNLKLLRDLYPELDWPANAPRADAMTVQEVANTLPLLTQVVQLMEDVYVTCQMERYATHPLNAGWMNYFGRWATIPLFRDLWPLLAPMYNPRATRFMEERYGLVSTRSPNAKGTVTRLTEPLAGVAYELWSAMNPQREENDIWSFNVPTHHGHEISVALLFATVTRDGAAWDDADLFVPPSFWAAGIGQMFLKELQGQWPKATVRIDMGHGHRRDVSYLTQMYRQADFRFKEIKDNRIVMERAG